MKKTALYQLKDLLAEKGRISTKINYKTVQRAIYSYNDRMSKTQQPEKKVNSKQLIQELKEKPTKTTLKSIIKKIERKEKRRNYKPKTKTNKTPQPQQKKYAVVYEEPPIVITPKKQPRRLTEAEKAQLYHFHAEERRKSAIAKKAAITLHQHYGMGVARAEEIGRLFAKVKFNDGSYIKDYISSDMVIEMANNFNSNNENELYKLLTGKANLNNNDIIREVNNVLGIKLYEEIEIEEEGYMSGETIFGG